MADSSARQYAIWGAVGSLKVEGPWGSEVRGRPLGASSPGRGRITGDEMGLNHQARLLMTNEVSSIFRSSGCTACLCWKCWRWKVVERGQSWHRGSRSHSFIAECTLHSGWPSAGQQASASHPALCLCLKQPMPNDDLPLRCCSADGAPEPRLSRFGPSEPPARAPTLFCMPFPIQ